MRSPLCSSAERPWRYGLAWLLALLPALSAVAIEPAAFSLWPGRPPGEAKTLPPEAIQSKPTDTGIAGRPVTILGNVSDPTITLYRPDPARDTGTTVLVCPGGGYYVIALDLEGTEVCSWLNSLGVTAVLLKYRVPRREGREPHAAPLQDAQRALGLLRHRARELGLDPRRIGVLGFSAGGHLAAVLSNQHEGRTYAPVDAADAVSCRPDFCLLIYPAYLVEPKRTTTLVPELPVAAGRTPRTFIAMTQDDDVGVEGALAYYQALLSAKVPAEMHLYPRGGHGYGLRGTREPVTTWPDRAATWLHAEGVLAPISTP